MLKSALPHAAHNSGHTILSTFKIRNPFPTNRAQGQRKRIDVSLIQRVFPVLSAAGERQLHRPREEAAGPEHHDDGDGAALAGRAVLHRQPGGARLVAGPGAEAAAAAGAAPAHHHRESLGEHGRVPAAAR